MGFSSLRRSHQAMRR